MYSVDRGASLHNDGSYFAYSQGQEDDQNDKEQLGNAKPQAVLFVLQPKRKCTPRSWNQF